MTQQILSDVLASLCLSKHRTDALRYALRELHRHGISKLAHGLRPCALKDEVIRECLNARAFSNGKVPH
jgi:hypothetical protein